jgi:hypothetical protein
MIDNLEKWKTLLAQTRVIYEFQDHLSVRSVEQLLEFENQAEFVLPIEYKEFCQIFGPGLFTKNWFKVNCSDPEDIGREPISNLDTKVAIKGSYAYPLDVQNLIDSAYIFGVGDGYIFFLFDLRTYSELDQSYEIYVLDDEREHTVHYLGQSFFEFIRDMCLGNRTSLEFPGLINVPEDVNDVMPNHGQRAFVPYSK